MCHKGVINHKLCVEGTRAMLTSGLAYKNMSSLEAEEEEQRDHEFKSSSWTSNSGKHDGYDINICVMY